MDADVLRRELVSPRVGVITAVEPQTRDRGEPCPPWLALATLAHLGLRPARPSSRIGAGKGLTGDDAVVAAIGEAIERYCARQVGPGRTRTATAAEVGPGAVTPADLVLYSDEQYRRPGWPFPRWSDATPIPWVEGVELPDGAPVPVPAGLTWLDSDLGPTFAPTTSSGLATGTSVADAVLGALCEVMERDAFLGAWAARRPGVEVDLTSSGRFPAHVARHYRRRGVSVRAFVLPSDLPATTVLALALDDDPTFPAQVVGLGCHPDPAVALTRATLELCQARASETARFRSDPPAGRLARYEDVTELDHHSAFASLPAQRREFEFLWSGGERATIAEAAPGRRGPNDVTARDAAAEVDRCTRALSAAGHRSVTVDLTLPDIRSVGLHVVRVLVTGLQPIHFGHGRERLGGDRLPAPPNPCPHPLA